MSLIFFTGTKKRERQQLEEIDFDLLEGSEDISHKKCRHHYDHTSSDSDSCSYVTHSRRRRKKQTRRSHKKKSKHGRKHHDKYKGIMIQIWLRNMTFDRT